MPDTISWDTAAFIALGNRDDELHSEAILVNQELAAERAFILTPDAVLLEVVNTFSKATWHPVAQQLVESLRASVALGLAEIVHVDVELWQQGWQLFCNRTDKDWSLTDCISFVVMQDRSLTQAFTSDRHFEQAGFLRLMRHEA